MADGGGKVVVMNATKALEYSWWERLHFSVFKCWPQSVVDRRLAAYDEDVRVASQRIRLRRVGDGVVRLIDPVD